MSVNFLSREKIFIIFLCMFCLLSLGTDFSDNDKPKTMASFKKLDDFPLHYMHYYGDYYFDEYLKHGSKDNKELIRFLFEHKLIAKTINDNQKYACTCFTAKNNAGEVLYGRNLDLQGEALLLYTRPSSGYASISMVNLNDLKVNTSLENLLAAPYIPRDGINEQGVAIATLDAPVTDLIMDPDKNTVGRWQVNRLILDYSKNVDDAVAILRQFNIHTGLGTGLVDVHYFIADASGDSAVIEFVSGEMKVIKNKYSWQAVANSLLYYHYLINTEYEISGDKRYNDTFSTLSEKKGILSELESINLLNTVSQKETAWSAVYNLSTKDLFLVLNRQYDRIKKFNLNTVDTIYQVHLDTRSKRWTLGTVFSKLGLIVLLCIRYIRRTHFKFSHHL